MGTHFIGSVTIFVCHTVVTALDLLTMPCVLHRFVGIFGTEQFMNLNECTRI